MTTTTADINEITGILKPLLGQKAWGVGLGYGSFITMEFGAPKPPQGKRQWVDGEWHLWIYCCAWRLEDANGVVAASEDGREKLEVAVKRMNGLTLQSVNITLPGLDTVFTFEAGVVLRTFSLHSEDAEHWMLYTPDGMVLVVGPGSGWSYESASQASA